MAGIRENKRNGKVVSYRFTACLDRDANGRQVRKYMTWPVPDGLTPSKAKKAAQRAADEWEQQERKEYQKELELGQAYVLPPEKRRDSFSSFVNDVWFPLQVCNGNDKQTTVTFYGNMKKLITAYFDGAVLQEISPIKIQRFLVYLRQDYKTKRGKPLAAKTIRHYYNVLGMIFSYAEKQGLIAANPMLKVDAPKKDKKPIDALSTEQAKQFFAALNDCPLDFRCMLLLLVTSGIRRGECLGLQWRDINERDCTITIALVCGRGNLIPVPLVPRLRPLGESRLPLCNVQPGVNRRLVVLDLLQNFSLRPRVKALVFSLSVGLKARHNHTLPEAVLAFPQSALTVGAFLWHRCPPLDFVLLRKAEPLAHSSCSDSSEKSSSE